MFYKLTRILTLVSILAGFVMLLGQALGYISPAKARLTFQVVLVAISLFVFYQSRPMLAKNSTHKMLNLIAHFLAIPLGVFGALCVTNESLANNYWFIINLAFIIFLTLALINLVAASGIKEGLKLLVILGALFFASLIVLQMAGKFNHGKIILYTAIGFTLLAIVAVIVSSKKRTGEL